MGKGWHGGASRTIPLAGAGVRGSAKDRGPVDTDIRGTLFMGREEIGGVGMGWPRGAAGKTFSTV